MCEFFTCKVHAAHGCELTNQANDSKEKAEKAEEKTEAETDVKTEVEAEGKAKQGLDQEHGFWKVNAGLENCRIYNAPCPTSLRVDCLEDQEAVNEEPEPEERLEEQPDEQLDDSDWSGGYSQEKAAQELTNLLSSHLILRKRA